MAGMNIIVDGLVTYYEKYGQGPVILLLHGWGDSAKGLRQLGHTLADSFTVLALDLPGFGETEAPKSDWSLNDYASFVQHTLEKLNLTNMYGIIGHSNGGSIAIHGIAADNFTAKRLVLLASAGIRPKITIKRTVFTILAKTGNAATLWMPERYRRTLRQSLYTAAGSDMLVVPELEGTFKKTVRQDVQSDAQTISIPTLLIFAAHDHSIPVESGQRFHSLISNSQLEILPEAGHFVHIDQLDKVAKLIKEFFK